MISVVICRPESGRIWVIDTWLMSCRVLGRRVEHMVLREILRHARSAGVSQLRGIFRPTDRNKLVVDHYLKLGFTQIGSDQGGDIYWQLQVDSASPESAPMQVVSVGFPTPLADNAQ
jgi:predicted enzyme involved in methoxymalonyl-ACP biosynthesis